MNALGRGRNAAAVRAFSAAAGGDKLLFTPGPLTTSLSVKEAMLHDLGSRDSGMMEAISDTRSRLLKMAHTSQESGYESIIVQGSGTFAVESVISSVVPSPSNGGKLLVVSNGAYGDRIASMAKIHGIDHKVIKSSESESVDAASIADALASDKYSHVAMIHHETTAGVLNPIDQVGAMVKDHGASFIVDSMSGFGAYHVDVHACNVDYLVSSANKNIEGVPGFAFAVCNREKLQNEGANARSLALDLLEQWKGLEMNGQFRFTPPCHAILAFKQALIEHEEEGGTDGRYARYKANYDVLRAGMDKMGFKQYVDDADQGCIIVTYMQPSDPNFDFEKFYTFLSEKGCVIYPGKLTEAACFRIGCIGRIFPSDYEVLVSTIEDALAEMNVATPVKY